MRVNLEKNAMKKVAPISVIKTPLLPRQHFPSFVRPFTLNEVVFSFTETVLYKVIMTFFPL